MKRAKKLPYSIDEIARKVCLDVLEPDQVQAIQNLVGLLLEGKRIQKTHFYKLFDYKRLSLGHLRYVLNLQERQVEELLEEIPKADNGDDTYNLYIILKYLKGRKQRIRSKADDEDGDNDGSLQEKRRIEIEILKKKLEDINKNSIKLEDHEAVLSARAQQLKIYFTEVFQRNLWIFENKDKDELREISANMIKQAMDYYLSAEVEDAENENEDLSD